MNLSSVWLILLGIPWLQAAETPGIRMTIEYGQTDLLTQRTIYLKLTGNELNSGILPDEN